MPVNRCKNRGSLTLAAESVHIRDAKTDRAKDIMMQN